MSDRPTVAVIGSGPAGLMAAEVLATAGCRVTVIERMAAPGRKFLLAGRGGLNLTHSEPQARFLARFGEALPAQLARALERFPADAVVRWAEGLGQPTFVGTSGRVFPKAMKASPLLRAWLARLTAAGVEQRLKTTWSGFAGETSVALERDGGTTVEHFDAVVLALGGASWPRLGSDGSWVPILRAAGVEVAPLAAANCGVMIAWSDHIGGRFAGTPLKRIAATVGAKTVKGEAMISRAGLEGGAIYALGDALRRALADSAPAGISIDLRPDIASDELAANIARSPVKSSLANVLRKAGLSPAAIAVLREGVPGLPREPAALAAMIKAKRLSIVGLAGLERAISTAGGVAFAAIDSDWMLSARPGVFVAGEMTDWTAPTGGYLLTACLASGRAAAEGVLRRLSL